MTVLSPAINPAVGAQKLQFAKNEKTTNADLRRGFDPTPIGFHPFFSGGLSPKEIRDPDYWSAIK